MYICTSDLAIASEALDSYRDTLVSAESRMQQDRERTDAEREGFRVIGPPHPEHTAPSQAAVARYYKKVFGTKPELHGPMYLSLIHI